MELGKLKVWGKNELYNEVNFALIWVYNDICLKKEEERRKERKGEWVLVFFRGLDWEKVRFVLNFLVRISVLSKYLIWLL